MVSTLSERRFFGDEPELPEDGSELTQAFLCDYYKYHNYMSSLDNAQKYFIAYVHAHNELDGRRVYLVKTFVEQVYGWIAKLLIDGANLPQSTMNNMNQYIREMVWMGNAAMKRIGMSEKDLLEMEMVVGKTLLATASNNFISSGVVEDDPEPPKKKKAGRPKKVEAPNPPARRPPAQKKTTAKKPVAKKDPPKKAAKKAPKTKKKPKSINT